MSRRSKTAARLREIARRRKEQDHTSHLTALREQADPPTTVTPEARAETPLFAATADRLGFVPTPVVDSATQLLPLVVDRRELAEVTA